MSKFPETARVRATKDAKTLQDEFEGLSDSELSLAETDTRAQAAAAANHLSRIRSEKMRRALLKGSN